MFNYLLAILIIVLSFFLYYKSKHKKFQKDWMSHGIPLLKIQDHASLYEVLTFKKSFYDIHSGFYKQMGEQKLGFYEELGMPTFFIKDLDLVKRILITDCSHFMNRTAENCKETDPYIHHMMTNLEGEDFKRMKAILSQNFTLSKIKAIFPLFDHYAKQLIFNLKAAVQNCPDGLNMNICEFTNGFAIDAIASSALGAELSSFKKPNPIFVKMAEQFQTVSSFDLAVEHVLASLPQEFKKILRAWIPRRGRNGDSTDFIVKLVKQVIESRLGEKNNNTEMQRKDLLQLLIDSGLRTDDIISQCLLFFVAGYDGVELLNFALYALAMHPEIQENVFDEVSAAFRFNDGVLTYEAVLKLKYLDMVLHETMRKYPVNVQLQRTCSKHYTFPGTSVQIQKGESVIIPIHSISNDPEYWPDPEKFDPERFRPDYKGDVQWFMGFGHGPRNCIGQRFGKIEVKIALACLIRTFWFEPCAITEDPVKIARNTIPRSASRPENGIWLRVKERRN